MNTKSKSINVPRPRTSDEMNAVLQVVHGVSKKGATVDLSADAAFNAVSTPVYITDHVGRLTFYNRAASDAWGSKPLLGDDKWCAAWRLEDVDGGVLSHAHEMLPQRPDIVRSSVEGSAIISDGTRRTFLCHREHLRDAAGKIVGAVNMLHDITDRKAAEDALQEREARLHLLARESDHRNANLLATVQAVARMTRAETVPDFIEAFTGRISALARVHSLLIESRWSGTDLGQLVEDELAPYRADKGDCVEINGGGVHLSAEIGQVLAMVLHELTTNAAKYGALSSAAGRVAIDWKHAHGEGLRLRWSEKGLTGIGQPSRKGFGSRLIEHSIEAQLGGTAEFKWSPQGLSCTIMIPEEKLTPPCQSQSAPKGGPAPKFNPR